MKSFIAAFCVLSAFCCAAAPGRAYASDWKLGSSVNYTTGKYGTPDRTNTVYVPFTLKRYYQTADLSVTVPWLSQSTAGSVILVGGNPVRVSKAKTTAATSTESGLGDILVRGTYYLKEAGAGSFDLSLTGKLKLPTADEKRGLGTGEMDEGLGLEFAKKMAAGWSLLADGYYTIIGDPAGINFDNQVALDIGFYLPLEKKLAVTVLLETSNALVSGNPSPLDLSGSLSYSADGLQVFGGLLLGLSDGSPALGLSAGISQRF